jgi:hemin uptake protein HemP
MSNEVNIDFGNGGSAIMRATAEGGVPETVQDDRNGRAAGLGAEAPEYDTETLFAGRREIVIHHAGAAYRMKITRQGKLILNK